MIPELTPVPSAFDPDAPLDEEDDDVLPLPRRIALDDPDGDGFPDAEEDLEDPVGTVRAGRAQRLILREQTISLILRSNGQEKSMFEEH